MIYVTMSQRCPLYEKQAVALVFTQEDESVLSERTESQKD